ncbi:hypothetical protein B0H14DRAFT_2592371 [Mycena olivaceomarginata]|nr:hypothetical protein B0H14DRAFT_2592371 [Mycena olivaceomarginata]
MAAYLMPGVPGHQPSHLEGDASLATEILPAPPSLLSAVQQSTQKRDLTVYSYLHPTDPGSMYSGIVLSTIIGQEEGVQNMKGKRSTVTGRARRASARNHNGTASAPGTLQGEAPAEVGGSSLSQRLSVASEAYVMVLDDETSLSRSPSSAAQPSLPGIGCPCANRASLQDERHNRPWCTLSPCELARPVMVIRHARTMLATTFPLATKLPRTPCKCASTTSARLAPFSWSWAGQLQQRLNERSEIKLVSRELGNHYETVLHGLLSKIMFILAGIWSKPKENSNDLNHHWIISGCLEDFEAYSPGCFPITAVENSEYRLLMAPQARKKLCATQVGWLIMHKVGGQPNPMHYEQYALRGLSHIRDMGDMFNIWYGAGHLAAATKN